MTCGTTKKRNEKNNLRKNEEIWDYKMHDDGVNVELYLQEFTGLKLGTRTILRFKGMLGLS